MTLGTMAIAAVGVLGAIAAVCVVWAYRAWRRTRFTWGQAPLMALNFLYTRFIWRTKIEGRFELPPNAGAVIVCNHRCPLDPAFIAAALDRLPHWMVAREYCENPLIGWFFRVCGCIPTRRGGIDTAATRQAIRLAQRGELVGILPEGRINTTSELLLPGRPGAALVALRAGVPVVPCYIEGSPYKTHVYDCLYTFARVRLRIGRPLDLSAYYGREGDRAVLEEVTLMMLRAIAELAERTDFVPALAGRFTRPE